MERNKYKRTCFTTEVQANMARYRCTSEHVSLQKYKRTWLATEVQANMFRYRSTSEHGWLQKYKRTCFATEVQANTTRYRSTSEHVSLALKRVKLWILGVPWRKETRRNHNTRRNRQLLFTLQCAVFGLKSREATDMTYIYAQQTTEFVMSNEVLRNAKLWQEIQRWCVNRRYSVGV